MLCQCSVRQPLPDSPRQPSPDSPRQTALDKHTEPSCPAAICNLSMWGSSLRDIRHRRAGKAQSLPLVHGCHRPSSPRARAPTRSIKFSLSRALDQALPEPRAIFCCSSRRSYVPDVARHTPQYARRHRRRHRRLHRRRQNRSSFMSTSPRGTAVCRSAACLDLSCCPSAACLDSSCARGTRARRLYSTTEPRF